MRKTENCVHKFPASDVCPKSKFLHGFDILSILTDEPSLSEEALFSRDIDPPNRERKYLEITLIRRTLYFPFFPYKVTTNSMG